LKKKLVFVDPGKRDLIYMMNLLGVRLKYSHKQRLHETNSLKYRHKINKFLGKQSKYKKKKKKKKKKELKQREKRILGLKKSLIEEKQIKNAMTPEQKNDYVIQKQKVRTEQKIKRELITQKNMQIPKPQLTISKIDEIKSILSELQQINKVKWTSILQNNSYFINIRKGFLKKNKSISDIKLFDELLTFAKLRHENCINEFYETEIRKIIDKIKKFG